MKILVTGANGQVGHSLINLLAKTNWNILALDRNQLDITDAIAVDHVVSNFLPDVVVNAAAYTAVDKAESDIDEAYKINFEGAKNLAETTHKFNAVLIHISTDYVFSGDLDKPYEEDDFVAPHSIYGLSKLKGELAVTQINPKHIVLRTSWVFGEYGSNFVKTMIRLGREKTQLGIVDDQLGGPTYAGDIAWALLKISQKYEQNKSLKWGVYHFAGFPFVSWFEFAKAIFFEVEHQNIYNKSIPELKPIDSTDYPAPAKRPTNSRLACNKILNYFDISMSDWQKAIKNIQAYS